MSFMFCFGSWVARFPSVSADVFHSISVLMRDLYFQNGILTGLVSGQKGNEFEH